MFVQSIALNQFLLLTLSAIDLHTCEINCTLKIFEFLAVETPCNRFTQRVQSIACCTILKKQQLCTCMFMTPFHGNLSLNLGNYSWFISKTLCCFKKVLWTYKYSFSKSFQHLFQLYFLSFQKSNSSCYTFSYTSFLHTFTYC